MKNFTHGDNKNVVVHIIVGLGDGGAEGTLYKIISSDNKNKHVVVSLTDEGKYGKYILDFKIPIFTLNFKKYRFNILNFVSLLKIIYKYEPQIIQTWMYHADFLSIFLKIFFPKTKILWSIRNTTFGFKDSISRYFISRICSIFSYIIPNLIISCGYVAMNDHITLGYNKKIIRVIYNGVDTEKYNLKIFKDPKELLELLNLDINVRPILGMVARYDKQKGHSILIKSLSRLKKNGYSFCCVLVGSNINFKNKDLITMIDEHQLSSNIVLLGQRTDLETIYNLIDILILPSINGEGFPNVLIEAMACQTPCIATDVGESSYIVNKTGWLVPPNNSEKLSNSIKQAINEINSPNWKTRQNNCRVHVTENYNLKKMVIEFNKAWLSVLGNENYKKKF